MWNLSYEVKYFLNDEKYFVRVVKLLIRIRTVILTLNRVLIVGTDTDTTSIRNGICNTGENNGTYIDGSSENVAHV